MTLTTGRPPGQRAQEAAQSVPRKATGLTHVAFHHISEEEKGKKGEGRIRK